MIAYLIYIALIIGAIILIGKDSASHRILKLILSPDEFIKYKRLHMIPGYAIYYLRKWAKGVKAREAEEMSREHQQEKGSNNG